MAAEWAALNQAVGHVHTEAQCAREGRVLALFKTGGGLGCWVGDVASEEAAFGWLRLDSRRSCLLLWLPCIACRLRGSSALGAARHLCLQPGVP